MPQPLITSRLQRRRAFFRRLRIYAYISGCLLIVVGILYLIIGSPLFKIPPITIIDSPEYATELLRTGITSHILENSISGLLGPDHYLAWPSQIAYTSPLIKGLHIKKSLWPLSVTITVIPRTRTAVWCNAPAVDNSCYWIDDEGIAFESAPEPEGQIVYTLHEKTPRMIRSGDRCADSETFMIIRAVLDGLRREALIVERLTFDRESRELHVLVNPDTIIIFSTAFNPKLTALPALHGFIEKPGLSKIKSINLTVEHRAYVKYK